MSTKISTLQRNNLLVIENPYFQWKTLPKTPIFQRKTLTFKKNHYTSTKTPTLQRMPQQKTPTFRRKPLRFNENPHRKSLRFNENLYPLTKTRNHQKPLLFNENRYTSTKTSFNKSAPFLSLFQGSFCSTLYSSDFFRWLVVLCGSLSWLSDRVRITQWYRNGVIILSTDCHFRIIDDRHMQTTTCAHEERWNARSESSFGS